MAKVNLPNASSGYLSRVALNSAFDTIEEEFNDKVLYRDNPTGEPNHMENDLDMNGHSINNLAQATMNSQPITYGQALEILSDGSVDITGALNNPTASNLGAVGVSIFAQKVGDDLQFRKIRAGDNINVAEFADYVTITGSAGVDASYVDLAIDAHEAAADPHPGYATDAALTAGLLLKSDTTHTHSGVYEAANANIQAHISSTSNPHSTTADQVLPSQTSNNGKFLTTNGTTASWANVSGSGIGDLSGPASAVNNNVAVFDGTTGKLVKDGDKGLPTGAVVGTTDTQTLTNKTLTSPVVNTPTGIVKGDVGLGNVDNTSDATKNAATVTLTNKTMGSGSVWNGSKIGPTYGGTDQNSWTKGDILYSSATNTLAKLNIGTNGQVLSTNSSGLPAWSSPSALSIATLTDTQTLTGKTIRTGDTSWVTAVTHAGWSLTPDYFNILSIGTSGKNSGAFFTHTVDTSPGNAYWCLGAVAVNDNTSFTGSYAGYFESFKHTTAHVDSSAHGIEIDVVNRISTVGNVHPYNPNSSGITEGLRVINQQLGSPTQYDCSVGMSVVGDGTVMWKTGLNFANGSCRDGQAISMPAGYGIQWYTSPGGITGAKGARIFSTNTAASQGMGLYFGDNNIYMQDFSGNNRFYFASDGTLYINPTSLSGSAGSTAGYLTVVISGTPYKLALLNV